MTSECFENNGDDEESGSDSTSEDDTDERGEYSNLQQSEGVCVKMEPSEAKSIVPPHPTDNFLKGEGAGAEGMSNLSSDIAESSIVHSDSLDECKHFNG